MPQKGVALEVTVAVVVVLLYFYDRSLDQRSRSLTNLSNDFFFILIVDFESNTTLYWKNQFFIESDFVLLSNS